MNTSEIRSSIGLRGELISNANIKIIVTTIKDKELIIYASDTMSGQIGPYPDELSTGKFLENRYFGFSNPHEINSIVNTSNEGLAIGATTYVTGRFP
ncbi:MAG TPA: hypothetical protein VIS49_10385 [Cyclobacteriaceae bacterium]